MSELPQILYSAGAAEEPCCRPEFWLSHTDEYRSLCELTAVLKYIGVNEAGVVDDATLLSPLEAWRERGERVVVSAWVQ